MHTIHMVYYPKISSREPFLEQFKKNNFEGDMDPPTHFHRYLGLKKINFAKPFSLYFQDVSYSSGNNDNYYIIIKSIKSTAIVL